LLKSEIDFDSRLNHRFAQDNRAVRKDVLAVVLKKFGKDEERTSLDALEKFDPHLA
jgi:hypothetical protein